MKERGREDYEEIGIALVRSYADENKVCLMLDLAPSLIEQGPPQAIADAVRKGMRRGYRPKSSFGRVLTNSRQGRFSQA